MFTITLKLRKTIENCKVVKLYKLEIKSEKTIQILTKLWYVKLMKKYLFFCLDILLVKRMINSENKITNI